MEGGTRPDLKEKQKKKKSLIAALIFVATFFALWFFSNRTFEYVRIGPPVVTETSTFSVPVPSGESLYRTSGEWMPSREEPPARESIERPTYPSGTTLLYFIGEYGLGEYGGGILSFNENTRVLKKVALPVAAAPYFAVAEKSQQIFYAKDGEVWLGDIYWNPIRKVASLGPGVSVGGLHTSPDEQYVAIVAFDEALGFPSPNALYVAKKDGSGAVRVKGPPAPYGHPFFHAWYPNSKKLVVSGSEGFLNYWEVDVAANTIKKFSLYGDYPPGNMPIPRFSPDGTKIAYIFYPGNHMSSLWVANSDGSERRKILVKSDSLTWIEWSPDGRKIAASMASDVDVDQAHILILDTNGTVLQRVIPPALSPYGGYMSDMVWTSDGRFLASAHGVAGTSTAEKLAVWDVERASLREYDLQGFTSVPAGYRTTWGIVATENRFYYRVTSKAMNEPAYMERSLPQLWMLDPATGENVKISDNAVPPLWVKIR